MVAEQVARHLFRGPRPMSHKDLVPFGINRVISLQSGAEDALTESEYEYERADKYGMDRIRVKLSNIFPPTAAQVNRILGMMVDTEYTQFVHCHSGVDRTGFMVAVYRMRVDGWTFRQAHAEWVEKGRHWWFFWWAFALRKWSKPI